MLIGVGVLFGVFCWLAILAGGKFVIQAWRELRSLRSFQDCPRSAINWCDDGNCGGSDARRPDKPRQRNGVSRPRS